MPRAGQTVTMTFEVRDLDGNLVANLLGANFAKSLYRRLGATAYAATSEPVTVANRESGYYDAEFTLSADAAGYQYYLRVTEPAGAGSQEAAHTECWTIDAAADSPSANDAFCAITDVEDRVQRGSYGAFTNPSDAAVLRFMKFRSARVETELAAQGFAFTVPAGSSPFSGSPTVDQERRLKSLCRDAVACAAAADAITAHTPESFDVPDRAATLLDEYKDLLEAIGKEAPALSAVPERSEYDPTPLTWRMTGDQW